MGGFTEPSVEQAEIEWLESLGWAVALGPEIAPDATDAESRRERRPTLCRTHRQRHSRSWFLC